MRTLRSWWIRVCGLFRGRGQEVEFYEELESHIAMHVADNMRSGMTEKQARREALLRLGGVESVKEAYRDQGSVAFVEHFALDLRFAVRQLWKSPVFAGTAILVLALGMCASIAIFAFVDAALIKPLPYSNPNTLMIVTETSPKFARGNLSWLDYKDWRAFNRSFESIDVFRGGSFLFQATAGAEPVRAAMVSGGFFKTLGIRPLLGRAFEEREEERGDHPVVMLSYRIWQQRFGGANDVLGKAVRLSGTAYTVIGVLPANFQFAPTGAADLWTLIDLKSPCALRRSCHNLAGVGRLKEGTTLAIAVANLTAVAKQLEQEYPDSNRERGAAVIGLADVVAGEVRPILLLLMAGAGLLMLISCVNVSGLMVARSEVRKREMAVRSALGASSVRLLSQLTTEGVVIVLSATVLAVLSANLAMQSLKALIPAVMKDGMPFLAELGLNSRVFWYIGGLAALAVVLFAAVPSLHLSFSNLRIGSSRGSTGMAWRRVGSRMVVAELAIAMVLLVGAGLLSKSLYQLLRVELGFRADHLATISVAFPSARDGSAQETTMLAREIVRKIGSLPGVQGAALTTLSPVSYNGNTDWIRIVGKPYDGGYIEVNERDVSANFFQVLGAKLIRGRYFREEEDETKPKVVIINQTLAKKYFAGEDPIGRQVGDTKLTPASIRTIVGVVEDIREGTLDSEIWAAEYHPLNQDPSRYFDVVARTSQNEDAVLPLLGAAIHEVRADIGSSAESTMEGRIRNSQTAYLHRSSAWLVGGFALMALILGVVGLYGIVAYSVTQRRREIGVRMALGARQDTVYRLILKEAGWLTATGIVIGAALSMGAAALAENLLFGVSKWDVPTLIGVSLVLGGAAMAASFVPARRAATVNPVEALRTE